MALRILLSGAGVFLWPWAMLVPHAGGNLIMATEPLQCIPELDLSVTSPSRAMCAMRCAQHLGEGFIHEDGVCDVYGLGKADTSLRERAFSKFDLPAWSPLQEMTRGKPVDSTQQDKRYFPKNAIDDQESTIYHSANGIARPWWMVDLLDFRSVHAVEVLPRYWSYIWRFHDVEVRIGMERKGEDFSDWSLIGQYGGPYTAEEYRLNFTSDVGICGRYVVIQKVSSDTDHLQLSDVKVYAKAKVYAP